MAVKGNPNTRDPNVGTTNDDPRSAMDQRYFNGGSNAAAGAALSSGTARPAISYARYNYLRRRSTGVGPPLNMAEKDEYSQLSQSVATRHPAPTPQPVTPPTGPAGPLPTGTATIQPVTPPTSVQGPASGSTGSANQGAGAMLASGGNATTQPVTAPAATPGVQAPPPPAISPKPAIPGAGNAGTQPVTPAVAPAGGNAGTQPVNPGVTPATPTLPSGSGIAGTQPVTPGTTQAPAPVGSGGSGIPTLPQTAQIAAWNQANPNASLPDRAAAQANIVAGKNPDGTPVPTTPATPTAPATPATTPPATTSGQSMTLPQTAQFAAWNQANPNASLPDKATAQANIMAGKNPDGTPATPAPTGPATGPGNQNPNTQPVVPGTTTNPATTGNSTPAADSSAEAMFASMYKTLTGHDYDPKNSPQIGGGMDQLFAQFSAKTEPIYAAMTAEGQKAIDAQTQIQSEKLQQQLATMGISNSGAFVRGYEVIARDALIQSAQIENNILQSKAGAWNNFMGAVTDSTLKGQLLDKEQWYNQLTEDKKAALQWAMQNNQGHIALGILDKQQTFTADQAAIDRKIRSGEFTSTEDLQKWLSNTNNSAAMDRIVAQAHAEGDLTMTREKAAEQFANVQSKLRNGTDANGKPLSDKDVSLLLQDNGTRLEIEAMKAKLASANGVNPDTGQAYTDLDVAKQMSSFNGDIQTKAIITASDRRIMETDNDYKQRGVEFDKQFATKQQADIVAQYGAGAGYLYELNHKDPATLTPAEKTDQADLTTLAQLKNMNPDNMSAADKKQLSDLSSRLESGVTGSYAQQGRLGEINWERSKYMAAMQMLSATKNGERSLEGVARTIGANKLAEFIQGAHHETGDEKKAAVDYRQTQDWKDIYNGMKSQGASNTSGGAGPQGGWSDSDYQEWADEAYQQTHPPVTGGSGA